MATGTQEGRRERPGTGAGSGGSSPAGIEIRFTLNGAEVTTWVNPRDRLLDLLRYRLGYTGTKEGCGEGECGACAVLIDGLPANSCLVPAYQVRGREVSTVESSDRELLDPLLRTGATQCGACTPGVVMTARWVRDNPRLLERFDLRELMAGNLCRCTGYDGIVDGVRRVLGRDVTSEVRIEAAPTEETAIGDRVPERDRR